MPATNGMTMHIGRPATPYGDWMSEAGIARVTVAFVAGVAVEIVKKM
jgi:hypothetical protein